MVGAAEGTQLVGKGREHSIGEDGSVRKIDGVHGVHTVSGDSDACTIGVLGGACTVSRVGCVHTFSGDGGACTIGRVG